MFFYLYTESKSEGPAFQRVALISSTKSEQDEKAKANPDQLVIAQIHHNPGLNHPQGLLYWLNAVKYNNPIFLLYFFLLETKDQSALSPNSQGSSSDQQRISPLGSVDSKEEVRLRKKTSPNARARFGSTDFHNLLQGKKSRGLWQGLDKDFQLASVSVLCLDGGFDNHTPRRTKIINGCQMGLPFCPVPMIPIFGTYSMHPISV